MNNFIAKNLCWFSFSFSTIACLVATTSSHAQYTEGQLVRWGANAGGNDTNDRAFGNSIGSTLPYIKVAAGMYHTVAIKVDGSLAAWGRDNVKQCSVPSGLFGVVEVAGGEYFSAAVKNDGTAVAWGANWYGQCVGSDADGSMITDPSTKVDATPIKILGVTLTSVAHISAGASNVLATKFDGTVVGWGSFGDGSNVVPPDLQGVTQTASGYWHSLALKPNGTVVGWGSNYDYSNNWYGQATVPTDLSGVKKIAASMWHSVALKNDGKVVAWGGDQGPSEFRWWRIPDAISTKAETTPITQMTTSEWHTTVVFSDGIVDGWSQEEADDDKHGEVPIEFRNQANPTCTVTQLGTGGKHTVAISSGTCATKGVICWGYNNFSQCDPPVSLMNVKQVAAGAQHTVVLKRAVNGTNEIKCLGDRAYQQADIPANSIGNGFGNPIQISAGSIHSAALLDNGKVVSWGGYMDPAPLLPALATQIDCGSYTNVARLVDGTVVAWGYNYGGECLGTDETGAPIANSTTMPPGEFGVRSKLRGVVVSDVVQVAAGFDTVALKTNGTLVGWPNDLVDHWGMPSDLSKNVMQIDVGNQYVALKIDGTVVCFPPTTIMPPANLSGVTQVASGEWRSIALKLDGTVVSWGDSVDPNQTDPNGYFSFVAGGAGYESLGIADGEYLQCGNTPRPGNATLAVSGSAWQDHGVWQWSNGNYQTPGSQSSVNLGAYGSVGIDPSLDAVCEGSAGTLATSPGSTIIVNAYSELGSLVGPPVLKVTTDANLSGRLWLFTAGEDLPDDLDMPVLTCATANGYFDILQSDIAPPAGKFLTLVPSDVNGRTVFSLQLLPMPSAANLSSTTGASASGVAIAAESMDFNNDGFDDIALAVQTGSTGLVQVLMNDGLGNLGATSILKALPATPTALAVGDFTGDGTRNDVVVGLTDGTVRVYINNGTGFTAGSVVTLPPGEIPTCVCEIKPDGASRLMAISSNFAVGTTNSNLRTYGSSGSPAGASVPLSSVPRTVHGSDIDDDDLGDVTAAGSTGAASFTGSPTPTGFLQVVRGTSNGFNAETPFEILGEPVSLQIADIDGDGLPDIVTANRNPQSGGAGSPPPVFALFRNNGGAASFAGATPIAPTGASGGLDLALVDVNSDGVKDLVAVYKTTGANSQAALININTLGAGYPLSIGDSTVISNNNPTLVAKGNLDGNGSEDVFLVQQPSPFAVNGDSTVAPFLGAQSAPCVGDLDDSGEVNSSDLGRLLSDFGICVNCKSDLNGNGEVDAEDMGQMLGSFGLCPQ
jgi:alpha-tubulin suppressor-like RCC1 family protein